MNIIIFQNFISRAALGDSVYPHKQTSRCLLSAVLQTGGLFLLIKFYSRFKPRCQQCPSFKPSLRNQLELILLSVLCEPLFTSPSREQPSVCPGVEDPHSNSHLAPHNPESLISYFLNVEIRNHRTSIVIMNHKIAHKCIFL